MPVITAKGLRKAYAESVLLEQEDVSIHSGERVGLVGANGCGKSTLARILADLEPADGGEVARRRDARILYLEQEPAMDPTKSAREIALEGLREWSLAQAEHDRISERMSASDADLDALLIQQAAAAAEIERLGGWGRDREIDAMLEHLGVHEPQARVGTMSGGERRRVALARLLVARPDLAILDEPTNHLDIETVSWLEEYLCQSAGALLLITHDRALLDHVCTRTLELDRGRLYSYEGGWHRYLLAKAERFEHEARAEANRQNFLRKEIEWLRRSPKARSTKQKARVQRAQAAASVAPPSQEQSVRLELETRRLGGTILELRGLHLELGGRRLIRGLDLAMVRGERIGIVGPNGCGKTSLLRALLGELEPLHGQIVLGSNTQIAYFDQGRGGLDEEASIQQNVAGDQTRLEIGDSVVDVRTYLSRFLFEPTRIRQPVGVLSGGERARVALAKLLLRPANLLLLDEPTNDLDVGTLGALEQMIVEMDATALIVSHDRTFLDRVATSILGFEEDGKVVRVSGGYEAYREHRRARRRARSDAAQASAGKPSAKGGAKAEPVRAALATSRRALSYGERLELEALPEQIEALEARIAALEEELSDPAIYARRGDEVPGIVAEVEATRSRLEASMERWVHLEERAES